jgi:hypothetical protein
MTDEEKRKEIEKLFDRQAKLMQGCDLGPITDKAKPKPSGK